MFQANVLSRKFYNCPASKIYSFFEKKSVSSSHDGAVEQKRVDLLS